MDPLACGKLEHAIAKLHHLITRTDQEHLDATIFDIVGCIVRKGLEIEITAELVVDTRQ